MGHVFFIEGLPGSGKTTFTRRLKTELTEKGFAVQAFSEGQHNPLDLAWIAIFDEPGYQRMLKRYPGYVKTLREVSTLENGCVHVAYLGIEAARNDVEFKAYMERHEIYQSDSLDVFLKAHLTRFKAFGEHFDGKTVYVFDGAFLQNHLNETMLKYGLDGEATRRYLLELIAPLKRIPFTVFYTKEKNVKATLDRISTERTDAPRGKGTWFDMVVHYIESQPQAKALGYVGGDGVVEFFKTRQKRALELIGNLGVDHEVFTVDQDYDHVFKAMVSAALKRLDKVDIRGVRR